jgi:hypothetical protein
MSLHDKILQVLPPLGGFRRTSDMGDENVEIIWMGKEYRRQERRK